MRVGGEIRVGGIELNEGHPGRIVQGTADKVIKLYGVEVAGVEVVDAAGDLLHERGVLRKPPALKIVAVHPQNIVEVGVAPA